MTHIDAFIGHRSEFTHKKKILLSCLIALILLSICVLKACVPYLLDQLSSSGYYETQDWSDYGNYVYTYGENNYTQAYIDRFFPAEISEEFLNVEFVYHSNCVDNYSFEAYLEFTIDNEEHFKTYVESATTGMIEQVFHFDKNYFEYVLTDFDTGFVYDHLILGKRYEDVNETPNYQIEYAKIAKILVNYDEKRIIYIAFALHDGGGTDTSFLNTYFSRFGIDPKVYEEYTLKSTPQIG